MIRRNIFLIVFVVIVCAGCGVNTEGESATAIIPNFVTSTLPPTLIPLSTSTPLSPTEIPTNTPITGTTNTQLNVRAGTSAASASLGMIGAFEAVQVVGKDPSGTWYQIIFAASETENGWVRAEYVQVDDSGKILPVETGSGFGLGRSGVVLENINVRVGPGAEFESLGLLSPKDVVLITGKDPGGEWAQVEVPGAENLKGWVTIKFLQAENMESVPTIGEALQETPLPAEAEAALVPENLPAQTDGDSMESPLMVTRFSPTGAKALLFSGDVSAPDGDIEDWVQFITYGNSVAIQTKCTSDTLSVQLWNDGKPVDGFSLVCGEMRLISVTPNSNYFFKIFETVTSESRHTYYTLNLETNYQ